MTKKNKTAAEWADTFFNTGADSPVEQAPKDLELIIQFAMDQSAKEAERDSNKCQFCDGKGAVGNPEDIDACAWCHGTGHLPREKAVAHVLSILRHNGELQRRADQSAKEREASHRIGFLEGAIEGIRLYAIWKDGTQLVGCLGKPLKEVIAPYQEELAKLIRERKL